MSRRACSPTDWARTSCAGSSPPGAAARCRRRRTHSRAVQRRHGTRPDRVCLDAMAARPSGAWESAIRRLGVGHPGGLRRARPRLGATVGDRLSGCDPAAPSCRCVRLSRPLRSARFSDAYSERGEGEEGASRVGGPAGVDRRRDGQRGCVCGLIRCGVLPFGLDPFDLPGSQSARPAGGQATVEAYARACRCASAGQGAGRGRGMAGELCGQCSWVAAHGRSA